MARVESCTGQFGLWADADCLRGTTLDFDGPRGPNQNMVARG